MIATPIPARFAGLHSSQWRGGPRLQAGQIDGPGFHQFDFSLFKKFPITERFSTEFRAEFFNILNHPNFNAPNFGGNGVVAIGGSGTSPIRTSARLDRPATIHTIRGRSNLR